MRHMSIVVARIGKPHGLRGEVTVQLHTDDPGRRLAPGASFATEARSGSGVPRELTIRTARPHNGSWLLSFEGIPDRTGAEGLRGALLVVDTDEAAEAAAAGSSAEAAAGSEAGSEAAADDEDAYYEDELVGLAVESPAGERLGTVASLETGSAQDLLVVTLEDGTSAWIPFVTAIVPEVDLAGGRIVVDPPAGLLDLNRS
jgi:16S rRNA processing protein RimM